MSEQLNITNKWMRPHCWCPKTNNGQWQTFYQLCLLHWLPLCCAMLSPFSCVWLFVTPWTVACQAPLSMGFSRQRILEWVVGSFSRGSSQPRDRTWVSCLGTRVLYCLSHQGSPSPSLLNVLSAHLGQLLGFRPQRTPWAGAAWSGEQASDWSHIVNKRIFSFC